MAMLITSLSEIQRQASYDGFELFCEEHGMSPKNPVDREEGFLIDGHDLLRYGMDQSFSSLRKDMAELLGNR